jgi:hypothetical protein
LKAAGEKANTSTLKLESVDTRLNWLIGILAFVGGVLGTDFIQQKLKDAKAQAPGFSPGNANTTAPASTSPFPADSQAKLTDLRDQLAALLEKADILMAENQRSKAENALPRSQLEKIDRT